MTGQYNSALARLREIDPQNPQLSTITGPNYVPTRAAIDSVNSAFISAQTRIADQAFPSKAGRTENHHITPMFLGGASNGPTSNIPASYHQLITNAFRQGGFGYGNPAANSTQVQA